MNLRYLSPGLYNRVMSRLRRLVTTDKIFFVTCNLLPRVPRLDRAERNLFLEVLGRTRRRLGFRLFAYVVMPSHWHGLIEPAAEQSISKVMHSIKRNSALLLNRRRRTSGPLWQSRFCDRFLRKVRDFREALEYIHTNPVRDGLVGQAHAWPWSSAVQFAGKAGVLLSVDPLVLPIDPNYRLR